MTEKDIMSQFQDKVKKKLKSELKLHGLTYKDLARKLTERGVPENERNLTNKISRGSFTAAFFMLCMDVIEASTAQAQT